MNNRSGYICGMCRETIMNYGGFKLNFDRKRSIGFALYLFHYKPFQGIDLGNAVRILKYSGHIGIANEIAAMLFEVVSRHPLCGQTEAIVPIPLHPVKKRARGFNQSELIAQKLANTMGIPCLKPLKRIKNTVPQVELSTPYRELNVKGAFDLMRNASITGKYLILLDDQTTTGATLASAAETLYSAGAEQVLGLSATH
jgi:ComF family protein